MNNLDYVRTLSAEELYQLLFVEVKRESKGYADSRGFILEWLNETRKCEVEE